MFFAPAGNRTPRKPASDQSANYISLAPSPSQQTEYYTLTPYPEKLF